MNDSGIVIELKPGLNLYCVAVAAKHLESGEVAAVAMSFSAESEQQAKGLAAVKVYDLLPPSVYGDLAISVCTILNESGSVGQVRSL